MIPFDLGGAVQGSRSQKLFKRRFAGEHHQRPGRRRQLGSAATAARDAPQQRHQQAVRYHAQRYRQILQDRVSRVLRVFQPHVLDHILAHQRRGSR